MAKTKKKEDKVIIKPCPYGCESTVDSLRVVSMDEKETMFTVMCTDCLAIGPNSEKPEEAVAKWNQRQIIIVSEDNYKKLTEGADNDEEGSEAKE